jgi:3',5'-cyclic-AMP phosphodiesterase
MSVTVLQISDTHFGPSAGSLISGYHPEDRLATVLDAWAATGESADLILLTGDNADDGTPDSYVRLYAALSALGIPILALAGNHDISEEVTKIFGGADIAELGEWRVVGFDSSRPEQIHGTVDVPAACELLDALDPRPTIVAIHHPPISTSTNPMFQLTGAEEFLNELAVRSYVKAVVSGHLHQAFEIAGPAGITMLGCPSTLMAISHFRNSYTIGADAPTGARLLRLADDGTFTSSLLVA